MYDVINIYGDVEFNGLNSTSELLSVCLIAQTGAYFYMEITYDNIKYEDFVKDNVVPKMIRNMNHDPDMMATILRIMNADSSDTTLTNGLFNCLFTKENQPRYTGKEIMENKKPNMMSIFGSGTYNETAVALVIWLHQFAKYPIDLTLDVGYYSMSKIRDCINRGKAILSSKNEEFMNKEILLSPTMNYSVFYNKYLESIDLDILSLIDLIKKDDVEIPQLYTYREFNDHIEDYIWVKEPEMQWYGEEGYFNTPRINPKIYDNFENFKTSNDYFNISRCELFESIYKAWVLGTRGEEINKSVVLLADYLSIFLPNDIIDHVIGYNSLVNVLILFGIVLLSDDIGKYGIFYNDNNPNHWNKK